MSHISIADFRRNLSSFLQRIEKSGETLIIVKAGRPVAEVKPVAPVPREPRPYGLCAGEFSIPADFDAPLPEDVLMDFEGR